MPEQRKVQCRASVDGPYASVRDALHRLPLASFAVGSVHIRSICDQENIAGLPSVTRIAVGWEHTATSGPLPVTSAEIYASAFSAAVTQLEIEGHVATAPGLRSDAESDRLARVYIHALLEEIIERLRHDIGPTTGGRAATLARNRALGAP